MKKSNLKKIILLFFLVIMVFFFAKTLYNNFVNILNYNFSFNYQYILISIFLLLSFVVYVGILWIYLINEPNIPFGKALHIHLVSWLAKYIPGNAGIVVSKIYFLSEYGIERKRAFVISIYENVFLIVSAFIISVPLIILYFLGSISQRYIFSGIIFVVFSIIFLHPEIFYRCVNIGLKITKKQELGKQYFLSYGQIVKYFFLYSIATFINGLAFYFMINGITYVSFEEFLPLLGAWNFASIIGILALFAPGGLGVREGVLILFLKPLFPLNIAILISVFSRFRTTVVDGMVGLYVLFVKIIVRKKGNRKHISNN